MEKDERISPNHETDPHSHESHHGKSVNEQIEERTTQIDTLGQKYVERNLKGSSCTTNSIDNLAIDIFETKPLRGSSYNA